MQLNVIFTTAMCNHPMGIESKPQMIDLKTV